MTTLQKPDKVMLRGAESNDDKNTRTALKTDAMLSDFDIGVRV